jgi:hypothetical protein
MQFFNCGPCSPRLPTSLPASVEIICRKCDTAFACPEQAEAHGAECFMKTTLGVYGIKGGAKVATKSSGARKQVHAASRGQSHLRSQIRNLQQEPEGASVDSENCPTANQQPSQADPLMTRDSNSNISSPIRLRLSPNSNNSDPDPLPRNTSGSLTNTNSQNDSSRAQISVATPPSSPPRNPPSEKLPSSPGGSRYLKSLQKAAQDNRNSGGRYKNKKQQQLNDHSTQRGNHIITHGTQSPLGARYANKVSGGAVDFRASPMRTDSSRKALASTRTKESPLSARTQVADSDTHLAHF